MLRNCERRTCASPLQDFARLSTPVAGTGRYRFGDFIEVGAPFNVVVTIVNVLLVPVFLPFHQSQPSQSFEYSINSL
jgi:hypothetical protein